MFSIQANRAVSFQPFESDVMQVIMMRAVPQVCLLLSAAFYLLLFCFAGSKERWKSFGTDKEETCNFPSFSFLLSYFNFVSKFNQKCSFYSYNLTFLFFEFNNLLILECRRRL